MSLLDDYEDLEPFDSASFSTDWPHPGVPLRYASNMKSLCQLCLIMERILTSLYGGNFTTRSMESFYNKAIALQHELENWLKHFSPLPEDSFARKVPPLPHQLTIK